MKKIRIMILLLFLLVIIAVNAQTDAFTAIQKIYTAYNTNNSISFNGSMKMYAKNNPGKIIEKMQSSYTLKGMNFICQIGPVLMLLNDNYYVSADKALKLIMVGYRKDLSATGQLPVLTTGQFKTWIKENIIEATVKPQAINSVLQLTDEQGVSGFHLYNIEYNTTTGYIKKVVMEIDDYNDPVHKTMTVEINYTIPVVTKKNKNVFSEKPFFSLSNNKIQVTGNYKGYQVINQL